MGVTPDGHREIHGLEQVFWSDLLRGLRERGLHGIKLVVIDAHLGLKAAISSVLVGAAWQRCRVPFMRNMLARVPRVQRSSAPSSPPRSSGASERSRTCCATRGRNSAPSPRSHRPTERSSGPTTLSSVPTRRDQAAHARRRHLPEQRPVLRLITAVCVQQHDEWIASERRYLSEQSMSLLHDESEREELSGGDQTRMP
jgi:putative transposase